MLLGLPVTLNIALEIAKESHYGVGDGLLLEFDNPTKSDPIVAKTNMPITGAPYATVPVQLTLCLALDQCRCCYSSHGREKQTH